MKKLLLILFLIPNLVTAEILKDYLDKNPTWSEDISSIIYVTTRCSAVLQVYGERRLTVNDVEIGQIIQEKGRGLALISGELALDSGISYDNFKNRLIVWIKKYADEGNSNWDMHNNYLVGGFADDFQICYQTIYPRLVGS